MIEEWVQREIVASIDAKRALLEDPDQMGRLQLALDLLRAAVDGGHRILICGNGGSACDSLHIAAELVGQFRRRRRPYAALALVENVASLTAIANDISYDEIFSRQVEAFGLRGDVLLALSTSGNSRNVVSACRRARELGLVVIGMAGAGGGAMTEWCDVSICIPSLDVPHIQEAQMMLGHIMAAAAEERL